MDVSYRDLLKKELNDRCLKNSEYSLRAFARDMEIEVGQLSRVFNGKKNISLSKAQAVCEKLYSNSIQKKYFLALLKFEIARSPKAKQDALEEIRRYAPCESSLKLSLEYREVIEKWYHIPILDLSNIRRIRITPMNVARYLGISHAQAEDALWRLKELGLLIEDETGRLVKAKKHLETPSGIPSTAIRSFHRSMIQKAANSLDRQRVEDRFIVGKTMAIKKEELPKFQNILQECMQNVGIGVEESVNPDSLYQLNIQLFDLKQVSQ